MPEDTEAPPDPTSPSPPPEVQEEQPSYTPDDLEKLPEEPDFKALPHEEQEQLYDMLAGQVTASLRDHPEMNQENWQLLGKVIDKNRARFAPNSTGSLVKDVGFGLKSLAKDAAAVAGAVPQAVMHPLDTAETTGKALVSNTGSYLQSGEHYVERRIPGTAEHELDKQVDDLKRHIDDGNFPITDPDEQVKWVNEQSQSLAEKQKAANVWSWAGHSLSSPQNAPLLAAYLQTRNPKAWDALRRNLTETRGDEFSNEKAQEVLATPGAKEFDDMYGKGASQHLINAADPMNLLMVARAAAPLAKAGKLAEAGKFAAEMSAYGAANAIRSDSGASLADLGHEALKSVLMGSVIHAGGNVVRRIWNGTDPKAEANVPETANADTAAPPTTEAEAPQPTETTLPDRGATQVAEPLQAGDPTATGTVEESSQAAVENLYPEKTAEPEIDSQEPSSTAVSAGLPVPSIPEPDTPAPEHRSLEDWADHTIREAQGRMNSNPVDVWAAYAVKGASHIARGAASFTKWSSAMVKEFGDWIKDHLPGLYDYAKAIAASSERGALDIASRKIVRKADAGRTPLQEIARDLEESVRATRGKWNSRDVRRLVASFSDSVHTQAAVTARQASNHIRSIFGHRRQTVRDVINNTLKGEDPNAEVKKDMEAAPFVVESYQGALEKRRREAEEAKAALLDQILTVKRGDKIGAKYLPLMRRALEKFDDLDRKSQSARILLDGARKQELSYGIKSGEVEHYVTHVYGNLDDIRGSKAPRELFGSSTGVGGPSKYFTKNRTFSTLAEAISKGYDPASTNIADLAEHRMKSGQILLERMRMNDAVFSMKDPTDGVPVAMPAKAGEKPPTDYERVNAAGTDIWVYEPYSGLFNALFGKSAVRNSTLGRAAIKATQVIKHGVALFDAVHFARVGMRHFFSTGNIRYNRGLSLLEYTPEHVKTLEKHGDISPEEARWIEANRPTAQLLISHGLNVGKIADALVLPSVGTVQRILERNLGTWAGVPARTVRNFSIWGFDKLTRGSIIDTAIKFYERNRKFGMDEPTAAQAASREANAIFGNVGSQGIFKSRTFQDFARIILFAPQWAEGTLTAEMRGAAQALGAPVTLMSKGKLVAANTARMMASAIFTLFAVNQLINAATTGHPTWQNEEGHKLDAWIPGGKYGFWFSPLSAAANTIESFIRYTADRPGRTWDEQANGALDAALQIGYNKLSGPARGALTVATGRDYFGRPLQSFADRMTEGVMSAAPIPIFAQTQIKRSPGDWPKFSLSGSEPGAWEKQIFSTMGVHVFRAKGPMEKMYALARAYRPDSGVHQPMFSKYQQLRRSLSEGDAEGSAKEIQRLLSKGDTTERSMTETFRERPLFTGSHARETEMYNKLSPEDKQTYMEAIREWGENRNTYEKAWQLLPRGQ
jgi:hypothetical protein